MAQRTRSSASAGTANEGECGSLTDDACLEGRTTIELYTTEDGHWLATQRGVDLVGTGETAGRAASTYCRKIDRDDNE